MKHLAQSLPSWKKDFKDYVNQVIEQCLDEKEVITLTPFIDKEDEEDALICLHRLQCLVAGAIQEWELAQQANHAYTVGSKTVAMFGYFALHAMWSLIAWESLSALAE